MFTSEVLTYCWIFRISIHLHLHKIINHNFQSTINAMEAEPITPLTLVLSLRRFVLQTCTTHPLITACVSHINVILLKIGIPEKSLLTNEEFVLTSTAGVVTLVGYYVLFGGRHRRKRRRLAEELREAQRRVSR